MLMDRASIAAAVEDFADAAAAGAADLPDALQRMARAVAAEGAALVRSEPSGEMIGVVASTDVDGRIREYVVGDRPPDPRMIRVRTSMETGFRGDFDDFSTDELERNPYYQEFLRPRGVRWHACGLLSDSGAVRIDLSLKRSARVGAFQEEEIGILDSFMPRLRSALRVATRAPSRFAEGLLVSADARGDAGYVVDARRIVLAWNRAAERSAGPFRVVHGKLAAANLRDQSALENAVALATAPEPAPSFARAHGAESRYIVRAMPVEGLADAMTPATCMITVIDLNPFRLFDDRFEAQFRSIYGLTAQEARIARQIGAGRTVEAAAAALGMSVGTARNHLKTVLAKTDTHRQSELALLWARLWL